MSLNKTGEITVTNNETGGKKGSKLARFDMIPPDVLWELAEHYGKGEAKYPSDTKGEANWQKGYDWNLSYAAMQRHAAEWWNGEDIDPETGSSHLISIIWHAVALRWFQLHGKGTDTRWTHHGLVQSDEPQDSALSTDSTQPLATGVLSGVSLGPTLYQTNRTSLQRPKGKSSE